MARAARWPDGEPLLCIDEFIAPELAATILEELEFTVWQPSTVVTPDADGVLRQHLSRGRTSRSSGQEWFGADLRAVLRRIERRIVRLTGQPRAHFETWQATRYGRNEEFRFHHDAGHWRTDPAGDRAVTILLYLDTPPSGGHTVFRELDVAIAPRAGRLVLWRNLHPNGECDPRMIHAGTPVKKGRKTTLVTWVRQHPIRTGAVRRGSLDGG